MQRPHLFSALLIYGVAEMSWCLRRPLTTIVGAIVQMYLGMLLTKLGMKFEHWNCKPTSNRGLQPYGSASNLAQPYANILRLMHMSW